MKKFISRFLLLLMITLASCMPETGDYNDRPVSSGDTPMPTSTIDLNKYILGEQAIVASVEPVFLESFPLQVHVRISGDLPDGCTSVYRSEAEREKNNFEITIITIREKDALCTQALVPFDINVPLDVYGLPAGTYTISVYDVTAEFIFRQDNIIQESDSG